MRNKKIFVIFLVLIFGTIFLIQPIMANGSIIEYVVNDSYTDVNNPNENYGDATLLYVMAGENTYLHFDFHNKPKYVDYGILNFVVVASSGYISIDIIIYECSFNESEIINNTIIHSKIGSGEFYIPYIDGYFTEYFKIECKFDHTISDNREELTFEISVQEALDYAIIVSKEGAIETFDFPKWKPHIEWFEGEPPNQAPIATITYITPNPAEQYIDTITFKGTGNDPDGTITAYEWSSSKDGILSSSKTFSVSADDLSVGTHTIYFRVKDDDGEWSNKVSKILTIKSFDLTGLIIAIIIFSIIGVIVGVGIYKYNISKRKPEELISNNENPHQKKE